MAGSRLVFGVGLNDYRRTHNHGYLGVHSGKCPIYRTWVHILRRCYDPKTLMIRPTYQGCEIADDWKTFSLFCEWMIKQQWQGMHIDKDILLPGNKIYGPDTCVFISPNLNVFLTDRGRARGEYPLGVTCPRPGIFRARCWNPFNGKRDFLGDYKSQADAHQAWKRAKHQHACQYAELQSDPRVSAALRIRYADKDYS